MHWSDKAIITSCKKYSENSAIITAFTNFHGIHKGLVRSIQGKKNRGVFQSGNIVNIQWKGRLQEHLGNFTAEIEKPAFATIANNNTKLSGLISITLMLESMLQEKEPHELLYEYVYDLISEIEEDTISWIAKYIMFEIKLLSETGFGIDIEKCVVCNNQEDLIYISPKSGRAVCEKHGKPYHDKLIKLPCFMKTVEYSNLKWEEIEQGCLVCNYFFHKYITKPNYLKIPEARYRFINAILKNKNLS